MKTLLLTLAAAITATIFSSCGCCNNSSSQNEVKHYDHKGRLIKEVLTSGNYNTYHYEGNSSSDVTPVQNHSIKSIAPISNASKDSSWKPRLP